MQGTLFVLIVKGFGLGLTAVHSPPVTTKKAENTYKTNCENVLVDSYCFIFNQTGYFRVQSMFFNNFHTIL